MHLSFLFRSAAVDYMRQLDVEDFIDLCAYQYIMHNTFYIYAFSRRFYPKRLTVHSGYTFIVSMCVPWELNPQPLRC